MGVDYYAKCDIICDLFLALATPLAILALLTKNELVFFIIILLVLFIVLIYLLTYIVYIIMRDKSINKQPQNPLSSFLWFLLFILFFLTYWALNLYDKDKNSLPTVVLLLMLCACTL